MWPTTRHYKGPQRPPWLTWISLWDWMTVWPLLGIRMLVVELMAIGLRCSVIPRTGRMTIITIPSCSHTVPTWLRSRHRLMWGKNWQTGILIKITQRKSLCLLFRISVRMGTLGKRISTIRQAAPITDMIAQIPQRN